MAQSRKTFASITAQKHPCADTASFATGSIAFPDDADGIIADELTAILEKGRELFGKSNGEWMYIDEHKRSAYIGSIRRPRAAALPALFANMFRNDATYGVVTPSFDRVIQAEVKNQILLDLDTCYEFTRLRDIDTLLFEKNWGNPFGLLIDGKVLAPDAPRHYYFAEKLSMLAAISPKQRIIEIGGGYGGLGLMLQRLRCFAPHVIVDLFETSLLQYYFLRKAGQKVAFVLDPAKTPESDAISIVPTDISGAFLSQFTDVGIVFNSRSFSEMSRSTVNHYFSLIQDHLQPKYIYHENSNFLLFPDSARHVEVLASEFPINPDKYRLRQMNISPFLGGGGRYREFLYESGSAP